MPLALFRNLNTFKLFGEPISWKIAEVKANTSEKVSILA
jgi:hypothetical protein